MKKFKVMIMILLGVVLLSFNAYALSIMPGDEINSGTIAPLETNNNDLIENYLEVNYGLVDFLYKSEADPFGESGPLSGSYSTTFSNSETDPSEATIEYVGGYIVDAPAYMVVKDGNHSPWWYLFNLTALGWNGMETLELSGFWTDKGGISYVAIYGEKAQVPEPSTLLLFGAGIAGLALYRRKRS